MRRSGSVTTVIRRAGDWEITTVTTVNGSRISRKATFRWLGKQPVVVTGAALRSPALRLSSRGKDRVLLPGNFPIREIVPSAMAPSERVAEAGWTRGEYAVGILRGPDVGFSVAAGYRFERDEARVAMVNAASGMVIEHAFNTTARLQPDEAREVGEQVFVVIPGDEAALRHGLQSLSDSIGNGPPGDHPNDLGRTVLYEVHPWGRLESWGAGDRGNRYDRLTALLPYYRGLGINALWLLPVSWPPPWVYTLPAFDRIAPENGTPEQLKALVEGAHSRDMRVLIDLVVYGIHPDSEEVRRLPDEVWCKDRDGRPVRVWGGSVLAADTSNPIWQQRIRQVADYWARQFGFDGTRMDCIGWGQTYNWASKRPNAAVTYGGLQLNRVVRDAFRKVNPRAVTLPEGGKPLVFRHADMIFDYPLYLAMRDLTQTPDLARWVSDLQAWLEWERAAYPGRALNGLVRFLELHDTVTASDYFGVGPSQALTACIVFMQGVPLLQQEQEIGFSEDLGRWLGLRNSQRCFTRGSARYEAVRATDRRLLTFLREADDGAAVVAINLTGRPIRSTLSWPADVSRRFPVTREAFGGATLPTRGVSAEVTVAPYRPFVILLMPSQSHYRPPRYAATGKRWTVKTSEGVLADIERDYATKLRPGETLADALPTLRRALQADEMGLMDGFVPRDVQGGPVRVTVDPWFVTLDNGRVRLTLARRHGGVPVRLERLSGRSASAILTAGGDAYADQGFYADRLYASADGETNPRLKFTRDGDRVAVSFSGILRQRSWNGVQSCPPAGPPLHYTLRYAMGTDARVALTMTLLSPVERPAAQAFFALRVPVAGFAGWRRGSAQGATDAARGVRLGSEGNPAEPLILRTRAGNLIVRAGSGVARLFAIEGDRGACQLFIALADGAIPALPSQGALTAEAVLEVAAAEAE
jgi:hypothetical protein